MQSAENIAKLKDIFPEVFTEGQIDFAMLKEALGEHIAPTDERYSFTWNGKSHATRLAQMSSTGTLRPSPEKSVDWEGTQNLYIEGDNLEVLKLLQKSYYKKIKMIYIDPPYNTGKDFVYKDDFRNNLQNYLALTHQTDENGRRLSPNLEVSGRFHTDWLNMMYPRLKLARNLLQDDGVIFMSIDDNEVSNLRKLCDEIFGEENFAAEIIIQSNKRGQTYRQIARTHEYLLIYTRTPNVELNELPKDGSKNDLDLEDSIGRYNIRELRNRNPKFGRFNRPNLFYPMYVNPEVVDTNGFSPVSLKSSSQYYREVLPLNSAGEEGCWRWSAQLVAQNIANAPERSNLIAKSKPGGSFNIYEKYRKVTYKPKSIWQDTDVMTEKGTIELRGLGLAKYFEFPKPVALIQRAIQIGSKGGDIILDFFAGSATTAHAVMQQNAEDGGQRRFVMVQLPEPYAENSPAYREGYKTICELSQERIRRAGGRLKKNLEQKDVNVNAPDEESSSVSGKANTVDIGFRVFKLDNSNIKTWDEVSDANNLEENLLNLRETIKSDRSTEDVVYELSVKYGIDLTLPIETSVIDGQTVFLVGAGTLIICLADEMTANLVLGIGQLKEKYAPEILHLILKDSSFKDDATKINTLYCFRKMGIEHIKSL